MKTMQRNTLVLALVTILAMPATLMAADATKDEHSDHHPVQAQATTPAAQDRMQAMRARMMEIRATKDLKKRKQLMEAQMLDMETMMQDGSCPMMAGAKGGGMMGGQGGMGMMGQGMAGSNDMMAKRMEMMEKRMDMMQMMMQERMGQDMQGGLETPGK
ncbi:MAG: hypothetical protein COS39_07595 [Hydrogenophilales bacterium CG03_land_8_20_14_0_80_62_28]|nr:hypothetical protein [Betaproteobacteria bacterium]PIV22455.1 MAG: hypothetical protein COS39_07595 [Hydrogenophilales bacterium CG03_land_8_20_14_0_80_62_28]PIW38764.1 MAG: hypothetical protein COW23_04855 [Hydrogenophilales bacterium CG15_BIG_FIL_POST_REV_8_21_14_020_62_31]PIW72430.1 MAG: hypothetical protein COW07_03080 [Hydrogenophilales bacterium CG12_big_fil_rev_8_21_14_0_65_61_21]PIX00866.1 MAG: hypothetical protein COZ79_09925 [Hydrogenophilales bacterium CG_4_8_14_3_um_filter_62_83]